jgi:hypothetical protein
MVTITNSTLSGNAAGGGLGGAIYNGGTVSITNSTLSGNAARGSGGAIFNNRGTVSITNSTLSGNAAGFGGGAIANNGTVSIGSTIIANSPSGGNCSNIGTITDIGYNLEDTTPSTCSFSAAKNDLIGQNPLLGSLANNGGPTQTMALLAGSPAIDYVPKASCAGNTDQRGFPRPDDGEVVCDIGAYESGSSPPSTKTLLGMTVNASQNGNGTVLALQTYTSPNGSTTTGMLSFLDSRLSHWPAVLLVQKSAFSSVVCTGMHQVSVFGTGTSNGTPVTFLITVAASQAVTGGDPLPNSYQIRLSNGYISGVIGTQSSWFIGC